MSAKSVMVLKAEMCMRGRDECDLKWINVRRKRLVRWFCHLENSAPFFSAADMRLRNGKVLPMKTN